LTFDPDQRITVEQCLEHKYLESYHDVNDEPVHSLHFDFGFEGVDHAERMRRNFIILFSMIIYRNDYG
jgi:mitogen-activated protein kinase 7